MRLLLWTLFLFVLWLLLTSALNLQNIVIGLMVSYAIALLYTKMFKEETVEKISVLGALNYIYILLKNLVISNIQINKRILRKDMNISAAVVMVKTDLGSDWKKLLLANSITLTPGTLTLDIKDDALFIHTLEYEEGMDTKEIIKEFEDAIRKI